MTEMPLYEARPWRRRLADHLFGAPARRGARLLDAHLPDWPMRVNTERLDLWNGWYCVLGQTMGYSRGKLALGLADAHAVGKHGFCPQGRFQLTVQTRVWKDEIAVRMKVLEPIERAHLATAPAARETVSA